MEAAILAIDQGTTGSRAVIFDRKGHQKSFAYQEFPQYFPKPGWVEHNPEEIWLSVYLVIQKAIRQGNYAIQSIAITNQRETVVMWDSRTGKAVCPAIVWQDRRTSADCDQLKKRGLEKIIRSKTGLSIDPYFSATKINWLFAHHRKLRTLAQRGYLKFGTIDSFILWKLTGGKSHFTDYSNASRTSLFNINQLSWDKALLRLFKIPASIMPEVKPSASNFGSTVQLGNLPAGIPIHAVLGDQQAALYGQGCYDKGDMKCTYGTGCFLMMNQGKKRRPPKFGILETIACDRKGQVSYAYEGAIFIAGAAIQWLRDGLEILKHASESEKIIKGVLDSGGITFIPAFVGLGSPYWNPNVRGIITGITRGTNRANIVSAALESIANQTVDVLKAMGVQKKKNLCLKVDGGATRNKTLMQLQADLAGFPVAVGGHVESTAWGVAKLAGRSVGLYPWSSEPIQERTHVYYPRIKSRELKQQRQRWEFEIKKLTSLS